jgi:predicted lipid carrier protein YhbT
MASRDPGPLRIIRGKDDGDRLWHSRRLRMG